MEPLTMGRFFGITQKKTPIIGKLNLGIFKLFFGIFPMFSGCFIPF